MSSLEQNGYEGTGHLPAPAHFRRARSWRPTPLLAAKNDLEQARAVSRGPSKKFLPPLEPAGTAKIRLTLNPLEGGPQMPGAVGRGGSMAAGGPRSTLR